MITIMSDMLIARLSKLANREQPLAAGDILFRASDTVRSLFLVITGAVWLTRPLPNGLQLMLQRAGPGTILAEASLFADHYHCDAAAAADALVRAVPIRRLEQALAEEPGLARAWTRHLAMEVQRARANSEVLSLKTVAARVDAWAALNPGAFPPKGQWCQVASEIGVTPEALYRELARRGRQVR